MAGDVRGPFLIWILFQKKGPATKQSSIKESAGGRKGSSDIQHLQTSVDLEVRNHIKNNGKPSLPRVLEIANTAIFRSICLFRDRLYLGYRGGLASCHLEDMFVGTRRLGSGFNVWGIILFLPRLALLFNTTIRYESCPSCIPKHIFGRFHFFLWKKNLPRSM